MSIFRILEPILEVENVNGIQMQNLGELDGKMVDLARGKPRVQRTVKDLFAVIAPSLDRGIVVKVKVTIPETRGFEHSLKCSHK